MDCQQCGHRFYLPSLTQGFATETFGDEYFSGGTDGYDDYLAEEQQLIRQGEVYAKRLARHLETSERTILDIGAAAGFFLKGLENQGWHGVGVEVNSWMADYGRSRLGLEMRTQSVETFVASNSSPDFDAVSMIQVLPHLIDPRATIRSVFRVLKPRGLLLIETWNRKSLTARTFGRQWHEYNPPSVLHWFTRHSVGQLLQSEGFEVVDWGTPTKWIDVGNGVSLIRHTLRDSALGRITTRPLTWIPKRLKVPYFLDDLFWIIARKRLDPATPATAQA